MIIITNPNNLLQRDITWLARSTYVITLKISLFHCVWVLWTVPHLDTLLLTHPSTLHQIHPCCRQLVTYPNSFADAESLSYLSLSSRIRFKMRTKKGKQVNSEVLRRVTKQNRKHSEGLDPIKWVLIPYTDACTNRALNRTLFQCTSFSFLDINKNWGI